MWSYDKYSCSDGFMRSYTIVRIIRDGIIVAKTEIDKEDLVKEMIEKLNSK